MRSGRHVAILDPAGQPGWHVVTAADFNADGVPDLVLQNDITRQVVVWYMGGAQGNQAQSFAFISGPISGWRALMAH